MTRIIKLFVSAIYYLIAGVRGSIGRVIGSGVRPPAVVLMYHSVKKESKARFERQVDSILRNSKIVPLDFAGALNGKFAVAITFDDGFRSVVENALPVLGEKKVPSTFFIPSGHLGGKAPWIDDPCHENYDETVIDAETVRALSHQLVTVGSHALTHRNLTEMPFDEMSRELVESKRTLSELAGVAVNYHAFPYGEFDERVVSASRSAGYRNVFAGDPIATTASADSYVKGRIGVTPEDWNLEFWLKCRGAYQWLPAGFAAKRKVRSLFS